MKELLTIFDFFETPTSHLTILHVHPAHAYANMLTLSERTEFQSQL